MLVLVVGRTGINPGFNEGDVAIVHFTGWRHLSQCAIRSANNFPGVGVFFQFSVRDHWRCFLFAAGGMATEAVGIHDRPDVRNIAYRAGIAVARTVQVLLVVVVAGSLRKACNEHNG